MAKVQDHVNKCDGRFAVFVLTHGRADTISTIDMLFKQNYTGDWYVVIDNEDVQGDRYRERFGDHVLMFDKKAEAELTDTGDTDKENRRVGVFARNAIQKFARELGYEYHLQLDDDFTNIAFRLPAPDGSRLDYQASKSLDGIFNAMLEFMDNTPTAWLSMGLSSDYIGGLQSDRYLMGLYPKSMGSFLLRKDDPVDFFMRMNDDITTTVLNQFKGRIGFSVAPIHVQTPSTQSAKGGMTEAYLDAGTYRKSFYTVLAGPSFAKISKQGRIYFRIHHRISWGNACPKILSDRWKK